MYVIAAQDITRRGEVYLLGETGASETVQRPKVTVAPKPADSTKDAFDKSMRLLQRFTSRSLRLRKKLS